MCNPHQWTTFLGSLISKLHNSPIQEPCPTVEKVFLCKALTYDLDGPTFGASHEMENEIPKRQKQTNS
jgi:hypothetical protein